MRERLNESSVGIEMISIRPHIPAVGPDRKQSNEAVLNTLTGVKQLSTSHSTLLAGAQIIHSACTFAPPPKVTSRQAHTSMQTNVCI